MKKIGNMQNSGGDEIAFLQALHATLMPENLPNVESEITPEMREALYSLAFRDYTQGKYDTACTFFEQLVAYDPFDSRYPLGWAASLQMLKRYEEALGIYAMAIILTLDNPEPLMRMGDCLVILDSKSEARECYEQALSLCVSQEHENIRQECVHSLAMLRSATQVIGTASAA